MLSEITPLNFSTDGWKITETVFDSSNNRKIEALFCQGNGYLHVRGSVEEHFREAPQNVDYVRMPANVTAEKFKPVRAKWGTYVTGIYGKHPFLNSQLINLPWFLGITVSINGEDLDLTSSNVTGYSRELCMKSAVITRDLTWKLRDGVTIVTISWKRFASAATLSQFQQSISVKVNRDAKVRIESTIDADVRTNGHDHFKSLELSSPHDNSLQCLVETDRGDTVTITSSHTAAGLDANPVWHKNSAPRKTTLSTVIALGADKTVTIEKLTTIFTSKDSLEQKKFYTANTQLPDFELAHTAHQEIWKQRWDACDIQVKGDVAAQAALRVSQYHLLRSAPAEGSSISIDAKGYAGEGYFGRFFWDSEIYLLPYFLYTAPQVARTLVDFRVRTLPASKANAQAIGYSGAKYAWEADDQGAESCALWQYRDHEIHITADVVYALKHYAEATSQPELLGDYAAGVLAETTRYWLQRVDFRGPNNTPALLGVMGPDEYQPLGRNNYYTNRLVKFSLECALAVADKIGLSKEEISMATKIVAELPLPRSAEGDLVLQSEDFLGLADPQFDQCWPNRDKCYAAQVSQERLYRTKNLKQADVLMAMYLFPQEFKREEVARAFDFYEPVTTHDSSLSCAIHSIIASTLKREKLAWDFFQRSAFIDLDFTNDGPAEGIHIAAAAGNWLVVMQGFLGMPLSLQSEHLTFDPRLPQQWGEVSARLMWKKQPIRVTTDQSSCVVKNEGTQPIEVTVWGKAQTIANNQEARWKK